MLSRSSRNSFLISVIYAFILEFLYMDMFTLAFTSGSASRVDVGLDVAGMWLGCWGRCGLDAGGNVAGDVAPTSPLKGVFNRISDLESRYTSTVTSLKWIQRLKISEKNGGSRHHRSPPREHHRNLCEFQEAS